MKRYAGQRALYEAISRTRAKSRRRGILELLHPGNGNKTVETAETPAVEEAKLQVAPVESVKPPMERPVAEKPPAPVVKPARLVERPDPPTRAAHAWLRPKAVQLHDGRIEVSVPYPIGITIVLVAILLVLAAFRLGQMQHGSGLGAVKNMLPGKAKVDTEPAPEGTDNRATPIAVEPRKDVPPEAPKPEADASVVNAAAQGNNVIVLAQYSKSEDLEEVKTYFAGHGIATRVIAVPVLREYLTSQHLDTKGLGDRGGFVLVTADCYDNPRTPGTKGDEVRKKIVELGRGYKAKPGFEKFAPNYFSDAYPMKIR
jgi:hypothetical protein